MSRSGLVAGRGEWLKGGGDGVVQAGVVWLQRFVKAREEGFRLGI